jgi:tRNA dimethylallyltransferase
MQQPILLIGGPTASGKSAYALKLAEGRDAVIINADSMQVYRELPILTAHPSVEDKARAPHLLYGFLPAAERCNAALWLAAAKQEIDTALEAGKTPIVVGGTGLYLRCLVQGIAVIPEIAEELRVEARHLLEQIGNAEFHRMLAAKDPVAASTLNPGDSQRILRAWEVITHTQVPIHEWQGRPHTLLYPKESFTGYFINPPREQLYAQCDARFLTMLERGALEEVKALAEQRLDASLPAMKALGVQELIRYIQGDASLAEATAKAQQATRNYAKRQVTWFSNQFPDWQQISTPH